MAFGFFKKGQQADTIFYNGQIYTHDPDFPWAEAVACANGKITAIGDFDAMDGLLGKHTAQIDLEGKYVFPGFIDTHRSPVMNVFEGKYLSLTDCRDAAQVCEKLAQWAQSHTEQDLLFGYGLREDCEPEKEALDQICQDRPLVLLDENGIDCLINTTAQSIVQETAEEECVQLVTAAYILNLLVPFDFEEIEAQVEREIQSLCQRGITSVLNLQSPDYFESLYQDSLIGLYHEGEMKQRFFGSYFLNRPLNPKGLIHRLMVRKTNCTEMQDFISAQTLEIYLDEENCPVSFSSQALEQIMTEVAEKGFSLLLTAVGYGDLRKAYQGADAVRNKGYKNVITISSSLELKEEDRSQLEKADSVLTTWENRVFDREILPAEKNFSTEEAIDELTIKAAAIIGMEDQLGKIEKNRLADFVVFDRNPLELSFREFLTLPASMTILSGEIVYDAKEEAGIHKVIPFEI